MTVPTRARSHDRETGPRPPRSVGTRTSDRRAGVLDGLPARDLFLRWQRDHDQDAHHVLVERHTPLARSLARRYARSSEPFDDLLQVALLGLVKAIERFDVDRGRAFTSFAVPTILGELRRYFRDCGWSVHMPRDLQERALKLEHAQERLTGERGRPPTLLELAEYLELDVEQALEALRAGQAYRAVSLEAPRTSDRDDDASTLADRLGGDDERYELVEADASIAAAMRHLPPRDRAILHLRFAQGLTQSQIATRIGLSQMQVSRIMCRSLDRLRILVGAEQDPGST
jgi:RNA polymerase sigma-B factor